MRNFSCRSMALLAGVLATGVGCSRKDDPGATPAPAASASSSSLAPSHAPAPSASASAWESDHQHIAPHGGLVHSAGDGHIEAKIVAGNARVWLLDHHLHPLSAKGATVTIRIRDDDPVPMTYDAGMDVFTAQVKGTGAGLPADTNIEVTDAGGKKSSARFFLTPE